MGEKALKFNNIKVNKKEFHKSKQAIDLDLVDTGKIIKAKVREFHGSIKTSFLGNNVPKENTYYTCIACITTNSVLKMNKKIILKLI